jgi:hypothetical protein
MSPDSANARWVRDLLRRTSYRLIESVDGEAGIATALDQRQRHGRDYDRARIGDLFHPRGQMRRLADRRVVDVQIAPDGPHDDLAEFSPTRILTTAA